MLNRRFASVSLIVLLIGVTSSLFAQPRPAASAATVVGAPAITNVPPPVLQSSSLPESARYYVFFLHVANLEKLATREEAAGKSEDAAAWRDHERRAAGLTEGEGAVLKEVANSYNQIVEDSEESLKASRRRAKAVEPDSVRRPPAPEVARTLMAERGQALEAFIGELQRRLGDEAFGKLDRYVRATFAASVHGGHPTPVNVDRAEVSESATSASPVGDPPPTPPTLDPPAGGGTDLELDIFNYVYTYSHMTITTGSSGTIVYAECGTILNGDTPLYYDSVVTECYFRDTTTNTTLWSDELQSSSYSLRDGGPFTLVPGHGYLATGSHFLTMFDCDFFLGFFWDPFGLVQSTQAFTNGGYIFSSGAEQCWPFWLWQLSTTTTTPYTEPRLTIQPGAPTVLPGAQQHFIVKPAYVTVTWSVDHAVGTSGIDPVSGVFTAPANSSLHGREIFVVTARSNSDPSVVASTNVTVDPVSVSIQGIHVMLAPLGASQKLSANVGGATGPLTWTMTPSVGTLAPEPINGLTATYTVNSLVKDVQTVNVTACLNPQVCSDPFSIELVPAVNLSSIAPLTWPAGSAVLATITGWGFGNNPGTVAATGISFFVTSWSNVEIKANVVIPQNLAGLTPVAVSNVIDGVLTSGQFNQVQVIPPTIKITVAPKTVQLREGEKQTFLAPVLCTTQDGKSCLVSQSANWTATAGVIDSGGVYTAPSNGVTTATIRGCATVSPTICDTATVTINLIGVAVIPSTATLNGCDTRQFGAQVTNGISPAVAWSITPNTGTIDATGFYKAPCPFPGSGSTVTVKACSTVDAARCGVATATLTPVFTVGSVSPTSGPMAGGTTVTIDGGGFTSGATVSFGGLPATGVTVVNGGQITAVTPSHTCGPVDVVVTLGGQSKTLTGGFLYTSPQPPTGLIPNGATFPITATSVTLSWAAVSGATQYAVRVQDNTDGTIRDPRNNCPTNTIQLCVNGVTTTTSSVPVTAGHSYTWWVHAGSSCGQYSAQTTATFSVAAPFDDAVFVSQTPPPPCMFPGSTATVSVTMRNNGNTAWDSTYRLGSQNPQDNGTWGLGRVFLAPGETVLPGQQKTYTFNVTMPSASGTYNFQWRMVHEGVQWFGQFSPNATSTNSAPSSSPTTLTPNGLALAPGTTSVTLAWSPTPGATRYAVRVQDNTDGSVRDPRNNCPTNTIDLCVNDIASTSYSVPVVSGHSYTWWVHAGNCAAYGTPTYAAFTIASAPLHAPTALYKEALPSRNLVWTPPDNLTGADSVTYDLVITGGANCFAGCLYHPGAPSWYTMGPEIGPGSYTWTLKANSASRASSPAVSGPSFGMP